MALFYFVSNELPDVFCPLVGDLAGDNGRSPRRQFIEDAEVEVAVERERQGPRDGSRGHNKHVRLAGIGLFHEAEALEDAEPMLLIDDDETEIVELDLFLN